MAKSSNKQIEDDKTQILKELIENPRQSSHKIGEKLGFSRQKVWKIIKELEKDKFIWGYTTIVDERKNNRNIYFALVKVKAPFFGAIDKLIIRVKEKRIGKIGINLIGAYYLNGIYDGILIFNAKDTADAKIFSSFLHQEYGEFVERIDIIESVFPLFKSGIINPEIEKMKKFTINEL